MASTYTTDLAIQLMATGENAGTWGQITNTNLVVIQQAIAGYQAISIAGGAQTTALVMTQNALANARNAVIKLTGTITGNQIVTIPNGIEKTWIVSNGTTGAFTVTFKYASTGTGQTWSTTDKGIKILYADQSDIQVTDLSTLSGTVSSAQIADYAVNTAELATNAVTAIKITQSTITQAKLAANSVGANQIIQSTITQSKLAANSVGPNQLISTGVTAASYTAASITVDADGRITAASSGSGGAGGFVPVLFAAGPTSGTYTKNAAANRIGVYMFGGGGGVPGNTQGNPTGPIGGDGGGGFYNFPTTSPFSQPYSVGAGGNGTPYVGAQTANAGGSTNLTNVGTVNGGAGASNNANGATGNQPGASLTCPIAFPERQGYFIATSQGNQQPVYAWGGGTQIRNEIPGPYYNGSSGAPGVLIIYENTGT
jgi:hypothetical protein